MVISFIVLSVIFIAIIISCLPLYFAVLFLGGDASILKVFLTNVGIGVITAILVNFYGFGGLVVLIFVIFIYSVVFNMGFIKAFFAWLLQYVIAFLLVLLAIFFGLGFAFV